MRGTLCFCLIALVASINAESVSIARERSTDDEPTSSHENTKVSGTAEEAEAQSDAITSQSETKEDTPSDMSTRSLFSGYRGRSRFGGPFSRSPWFSSKYDMFPSSPFSDEFDSFYGNSLYGDEDLYSTMGYDEQYPGMYGGYGMMGGYDRPFYSGGSQGRYPSYDQQRPPSSSYYSDRPGETNARPQEYYRGQPAESQRFSGQGTPYDRNRIDSNVQPQRRPYRNRPSTPYNPDQRREPQQYDPEQRRRPTNVPNHQNSNVDRPDGGRTESQSSGIVPTIQRIASTVQPQSLLAPVERIASTVLPQSLSAPIRDQREETSSTTSTVPESPNNRTQDNESNSRS